MMQTVLALWLLISAAPAHATSGVSVKQKLAQELMEAHYPQLARDELLPTLYSPLSDLERQWVWSDLLRIVDKAGGRWMLRKAAMTVGPTGRWDWIWPRVQYMVGVSLWEQGDLGNAGTALQEVGDASAVTPRAAYLRMLLYLKSGQTALAATQINTITVPMEEGSKNDPNRSVRVPAFEQLAAQMQLYTAYYYYNIGRFDNAQIYLEPLLDHPVYGPDAVLAMGWIRAQQARGPADMLAWLEKYHHRLGTRLSPEFLYLEAVVRVHVRKPILPLAHQYEAENAADARALIGWQIGYLRGWVWNPRLFGYTPSTSTWGGRLWLGYGSVEPALGQAVAAASS